MKKFYLLLLSIFLTFCFSSQAIALPVLPAQGEQVVFEFNSWEFISNREIDSSSSLALAAGDTFEGVLMLDGLTDGTNEIWSPQATGHEITAHFSGLVITGFTPIDLDLNGIPDFVSATYSFVAGSTVDIYFDETPDLTTALEGTYATVGAGRAAAKTAATDGIKLLQLEWGEYRTLAQTGNTLTTDDDTTDSDGHMNVTPDLANEWLWNDLFKNGVYEYPIPGTFYDFVYTNVIYAPHSQIFMQNAGYYTSDGDAEPILDEDLIWDFYNTDDFRGLSNIPEPATLLLLGFGLLSIAGISRRKIA